MARQREIQIARYKKHIGTSIEVMVEGYNASRGQWVGRTSQNKTLNFTAGDGATSGSETESKAAGRSPRFTPATSKAKATDKPALNEVEGSVRPTQATSTAADCGPKVGTYASVRVTASFPNSLVGELVV
jgi:hypothetical protein